MLAGFAVMHCPQCDLCFLGPGGGSAASLLDRGEFEDAFYSLRVANYDTILTELAHLGSGRQLLDVGCSSGWFLSRALTRGYDCHGIEPDEFFLQQARRRLPSTIELVHGLFDNDVPAAWGGFDVITFHDVFEHVPEPVSTLEACRRRLAPDGLIVLSVPSSAGFVYAIGTWLYRLGFGGPLERMYQVHYPYPHLFYFNDRSIAVLADRAGFDVVRSFGLAGFSVRGALHRARMDKAAGMLGHLRNAVSAAALASFALIQYGLPSDNAVFILKPKPI